MIDSFNPASLSFPEEFSLSQVLVEIASLSDPPLPVTSGDLAPLDPEEQMRYVLQLAKHYHALPVDMTLPQFAEQVEQFRSDHRAFAHYLPMPYKGPVLLLTSTESLSISPDPTLGWGSLIAELQTHTITGTHLSLMRDREQVSEVADVLLPFFSQPHAASGSNLPLLLSD
ncbi:MAG: hypothetical protein HC921_20680 [Synechococcaceae cyanobacterium SM2_3_1]|nr:hypothetical protein [Synechococcaceae cyanobacterium SM2_3_1]